MITFPASPLPKVLASIIPPSLRYKLLVLISIPPEFPCANEPTWLKIALLVPIVFSPTMEISPVALIKTLPASPVPKVVALIVPPLVTERLLAVIFISPAVPVVPENTTFCTRAFDMVISESKPLVGKFSLKLLPVTSNPTVPAVANPPNSMLPPVAVNLPPSDKLILPPTSAREFPGCT